jgi:hypothetical protein
MKSPPFSSAQVIYFFSRLNTKIALRAPTHGKQLRKYYLIGEMYFCDAVNTLHAPIYDYVQSILYGTTPESDYKRLGVTFCHLAVNLSTSLPQPAYLQLRWVHTCNVTAYCNAVTFQVTDTIEVTI